MTFFGVALLTAIPTAVLAVFAIITAWYARLAFRKQSQEVAAIEQQVKDEQEVTRQQAELLKVQIAQLEVLREQVDDQRKASAAQAEVLELQAAELRESLEERKQEAQQRRRGQASRVFITAEARPHSAARSMLSGPTIYANVVNSSPDPVYDAELRWHQGSVPHGEPYPAGIVMPGIQFGESHTFPRDANLDVCGAVLTFRDAAGVRWMRRPDGELIEQQ